jgi:hypothetical protein
MWVSENKFIPRIANMKLIKNIKPAIFKSEGARLYIVSIIFFIDYDARTFFLVVFFFFFFFGVFNDF